MVSRIFTIIFSFLIIQVSYCFSNNFEIVDLGLQESDESNAHIITENGNIYGTFKFQGQEYTFIWNESEGLTAQLKLLENLDPNQDGAIISSLTPGKSNSSGQIIYHLSTATRHNLPTGFTLKDIRQQAFIKNVDGEMIEIGSFGGKETFARDLNDVGQVVGTSQTVDGKRRAFLWQNGVMTDLGTLLGDLGLAADQSSAIAINDKGQIIGSSKYAVIHKGKVIKNLDKAFLWENGKMQILMDNISTESGAYGITNSGIAFLYTRKVGEGTASSKPTAYDTKSKTMKSLSFRPIKIQKNKVLASDRTLYDYTSIDPVKIVNVADLIFSNSDYNSYWLEIERIIGFNSQDYIIAQAKNIYEEKHVILVRPIK